VLTITAAGQVVRSPINADFRPMGRSTQGVKFVSPKSGDSVAVVARSVEVPEAEEDSEDRATDAGGESPDVGTDATIDGTAASDEGASTQVEEQE